MLIHDILNILDGFVVIRFIQAGYGPFRKLFDRAGRIADDTELLPLGNIHQEFEFMRKRVFARHDCPNGRFFFR